MRRAEPFDWLCLYPFAYEDANFDTFRDAVGFAWVVGDDCAVYIYARMSARYAIRNFGFSALPQ